MIGDCKTRMENAFNDLLAAAVRSSPHLFSHPESPFSELSAKNIIKHIPSPLFSFRAGRGCGCRNKTHASDHQSNQNNPDSLTTNPSIFQTVSTLAHVPLEPPPLRASSRSLSLSAGIEAQDEHGADAAESEELAAAKAVLDEVEPMLEA